MSDRDTRRMLLKGMSHEGLIERVLTLEDDVIVLHTANQTLTQEAEDLHHAAEAALESLTAVENALDEVKLALGVEQDAEPQAVTDALVVIIGQ